MWVVSARVPAKTVCIVMAVPFLRGAPSPVLSWIGNTASSIIRNRALNDHLRARGYPIFVIGANSNVALDSAAQLGATAVLTDRPEWLNGANATFSAVGA